MPYLHSEGDDDDVVDTGAATDVCSVVRSFICCVSDSALNMSTMSSCMDRQRIHGTHIHTNEKSRTINALYSSSDGTPATLHHSTLIFLSNKSNMSVTSVYTMMVPIACDIVKTVV